MFDLWPEHICKYLSCGKFNWNSKAKYNDIVFWYLPLIICILVYVYILLLVNIDSNHP